MKLTLEDSLFDDHKSKDLDSNLEYMLNNFRYALHFIMKHIRSKLDKIQRIRIILNLNCIIEAFDLLDCALFFKCHSFFIPSIDYLTDLPGLLDYLAQKITVGYTCLYCDKEFGSLKGVRQHMVSLYSTSYSFVLIKKVDKCHCMMQWEFLEEYEDFYKFPKKSTVSQFINELGELEETQLAYVKPSGELVITGDNTTKTLGLRQYSPFYKQVLFFLFYLFLRGEIW